jgi:hypothetical protein
MFQTWAVKTVTTLAHSTPNRLPGKSETKKVIKIVRKLSTGMDCMMSRNGRMIARAILFFAAAYPIIKVKISEKPNAIHIRIKVRPI